MAQESNSFARVNRLVLQRGQDDGANSSQEGSCRVDSESGPFENMHHNTICVKNARNNAPPLVPLDYRANLQNKYSTRPWKHLYGKLWHELLGLSRWTSKHSNYDSANEKYPTLFQRGTCRNRDSETTHFEHHLVDTRNNPDTRIRQRLFDNPCIAWLDFAQHHKSHIGFSIRCFGPGNHTFLLVEHCGSESNESIGNNKKQIFCTCFGSARIHRRRFQYRRCRHRRLSLHRIEKRKCRSRLWPLCCGIIMNHHES